MRARITAAVKTRNPRRVIGHRTPSRARDVMSELSSAFLLHRESYGRGTGLGRGRGVGVARGIAVAVGVAVAVAVGVAVAVAVAVGVGVGLG